jgi:hypothetical protein
MERKYLAATLALAATFAIVSGEFRSGNMAKLPHSRAEAVADLACARRYVAARLMAKLQPYVDHSAPEQAQMVAELNLPQLARVEQKVSDAQAVIAQEAGRQKCETAKRTQLAKQQVFEMRILSTDRAQELSNLAVVRAQDFSEHAQEWNAMASDRALQMNERAMERAQEITARAMERAQREMERSRSKLAHSQGMPIHINFVAPVMTNVTVPVKTNVTVHVPVPPAPPSNSFF